MKKLLALSALALSLSATVHAGLLEDVQTAVKDKSGHDVVDAAVKAAVDAKSAEAVICIEKKDSKLVRTHSADASLNGEIPASDADGLKIANEYFTDEDGNLSYTYKDKSYTAKVAYKVGDVVCVVRSAPSA
jgi:hypothetical protein